MQIRVRFSAGLARLTGSPRLQVEMTEGATLAALLARLQEQFPDLAPHLTIAVPMVGGLHAGPAQALAHDEEVALLVPAAGG